MAIAIIVVLEIGFIVFFIVRNKIVQCESIMCRNEIDACSRSAVIVFVEIRAACKAQCEFTKHTIGATPVIANAIPVFSVPFCPAGRKFSYLVSTFSNIPWFCDQLYLRDYGVLVNDVEERTQPVHF